MFEDKLKRKVPLKTPEKRAKITSLVIKAKIMATKGGIRVKTPKSSALVLAKFSSASNNRGKNKRVKILII